MGNCLCKAYAKPLLPDRNVYERVLNALSFCKVDSVMPAGFVSLGRKHKWSWVAATAVASASNHCPFLQGGHVLVGYWGAGQDLSITAVFFIITGYQMEKRNCETQFMIGKMGVTKDNSLRQRKISCRVPKIRKIQFCLTLGSIIRRCRTAAKFLNIVVKTSLIFSAFAVFHLPLRFSHNFFDCLASRGQTLLMLLYCLLSFPRVCTFRFNDGASDFLFSITGEYLLISSMTISFSTSM